MMRRPRSWGKRSRNGPGRLSAAASGKAVGDDDRLAPDAQCLGFKLLLVARVVHQRRMGQDAPLDQSKRQALQPGPPMGHAPVIQGAKRPDDVGDVAARGPERGRERRKREQRVDVHDVEVGHVL